MCVAAPVGGVEAAGNMASSRTLRRPHGYTYLFVLFAVAVLGLVSAQAGLVWQAVAQREREAELLAIGVEMARALARYRGETPAGQSPMPTRLEQLVEDQRFPTPRRHLRRIYRDPLTGRAEWGVVKTGDVIVGVHSLSKMAPLRREDLPLELGNAAKSATMYSEWVFQPSLPGVSAVP